jgi:hypothetical protein
MRHPLSRDRNIDIQYKLYQFQILQTKIEIEIKVSSIPGTSVLYYIAVTYNSTVLFHIYRMPFEAK